MSGDDHVAPGAEPSRDGDAQSESKGLHRWMKAFFDRTALGKRLNRHEEELRAVDGRIDGVEVRLDGVEDGVRIAQQEIADLRDERVSAAEGRLDAAEDALAVVAAEATRLRDEVVPATVGRSDALFERLGSEIDEVGSLIERVLLEEPLPAPGTGVIDEAKLAAALAEVQPELLTAFRGTESEIRHRLDHYLDELQANAPVLDLGCGRGELLLMLREAGVEAMGIEGDAAVAQSARRRGLIVEEGDVLDAIRRQPDVSCGAVTAIHLFEHLEPAVLMAVLAEVRRVLVPGGILVAECPNPHSLRVGAALFWLDPTHRRPLMPETLELYLRTGGFAVDRTEMLHPFPAEQLFAGDPDVDDDTLARRLDELINGPRDFAVWATKPEHEPS